MDKINDPILSADLVQSAPNVSPADFVALDAYWSL